MNCTRGKNDGFKNTVTFSAEWQQEDDLKALAPGLCDITKVKPRTT